MIVSGPEHGSLVALHQPNRNVSIFSMQQLRGNQIKV